MAGQAAELQQENQNLQTGIDGLDPDDSVKKIARDKLGLVGNGEIIFSDVGSNRSCRTQEAASVFSEEDEFHSMD